ncbi:hypothetical protein CC80DRAFT_510807 [Byssothecium circinans]|uniref:Uncharacterized protein n=1 Tax=Byssothecium circinans TaxID=147558 RepID=A0A6A5T937_9PLEO|nr:hypothetical protein CC80DRAFT_510807 [Byssothecium circinans]
MRRRQRLQRSITREFGAPRTFDDNGQPILAKPGDIRLFSTYEPSLKAGTYSIDVKQEINVPGKSTSPIQNTDSAGNVIQQTFTVEAPRFSLEANEIHSFYPPSGHGDDPHVLPHVVFNDPHLPWERNVDESVDTKDNVNDIPWLAVLVFDPAELNVDGTILQNGTLKQSPTKEVPITVDQLLKLKNVAVPIDLNESMPTLDRNKSTTAIFVKPGLFRAMHDWDADGQTINLERYKYLAHVRDINTSGGAIAAYGDENGLYSVVFSHRTPPLLTKESTVVVHLLSLDGVREHVKIDQNTNYVSLISLHSWQYQCLPPSSLDFPRQLQFLGTQATAMLRPSGIEKVKDARLAARLSNGYSLVRHRVSTGEQTVAFLRGPLSPVPVPYPLLPKRGTSGPDAGTWPAESFYSTDYQVLDHELGIMDISYATAWQVGREMAMADRTFAQALVSVRGEAHEAALPAAKAEFLSSSSSHQTRTNVLNTLNELVQAINDPYNLPILAEPTSSPQRWTFTPGTREDLSTRRAEIQALYSKHLQLVLQKMTTSFPRAAMSTDNESSTCAHWPIVSEWLLDRMKLVNLPAIYLLNHPDNLPKESIRFFHVDQNWLAVQIDGALSIGNHVSRPTSSPSQADFIDQIRQLIKENFASYIANPPNAAAICPTGGFCLRSAIVKAFPDMIISSASKETQILSTSGLSEDTLLTLMTHTETQDTHSLDPAIIISQPPHQQRFALGGHLDKESLTFAYKKVYTVDGSAPQGRPWGATGVEDIFLASSDLTNSIYDWSSRMVNVKELAVRTLKELKIHMAPTDFDLKDTLSSAVMAVELNDPLYQLVFLNPTASREWASAPLYGSDFTNTSKNTSRKYSKEPSTAISVPLPGKSVLKPTVAHKRPRRATKGLPLELSGLRAPHRPLPLRSLPKEVPAAPKLPGSPSIQSQVSLRVFANVVQPSAPLPTNLAFYADIVFALRKNASNAGLLVRSLAVRIPVANLPSPSKFTNTTTVPLLMQAYDGPGPIMLGNNRFNATLGSAYTTSPAQNWIVINILPRSFSGVVTFDDNPGFSCLLRQVAIDASTLGSVPFTLIERYTLPLGSSVEVQTDFPVTKS